MTIEGAIAQLQELINNDEIPFWAKPSLQKVMETVEMEWEQHIEERETGKWIDTGSGQECSCCGEIQYGYDNHRRYCPYCGAKMERGMTKREVTQILKEIRKVCSEAYACVDCPYLNKETEKHKCRRKGYPDEWNLEGEE